MTAFPDDENGNVLRRMENSGDDSSKPRVIDFSLVFPTFDGAKGFSDLASTDDFKVQVLDELTEDGEVDVTASIKMTPTHEGISGVEQYLEALSARFGGRNDGWGCFEVRIDGTTS